jgi:hypothetical protein
MKKAAAKRDMTTTATQSEIDRYEAIMTAKQQFVGAAMDMGWRLALTVVIPVIVGVKLDDRFHTTPSYTLTALFIAVGGASVVIWQTIKQVNKEQLPKGTKKKT